MARESALLFTAAESAIFFVVSAGAGMLAFVIESLAICAPAAAPSAFALFVFWHVIPAAITSPATQITGMAFVSNPENRISPPLTEKVCSTGLDTLFSANTIPDENFLVFECAQFRQIEGNSVQGLFVSTSHVEDNETSSKGAVRNSSGNK
jgi:hypothetical protein